MHCVHNTSPLRYSLTKTESVTATNWVIALRVALNWQSYLYTAISGVPRTGNCVVGGFHLMIFATVYVSDDYIILDKMMLRKTFLV